MMTATMIADFDTIPDRHGDQLLDSPVMRVMAHLLKLFFRGAHKETILNTVLRVKCGRKADGTLIYRKQGRQEGGGRGVFANSNNH